jgi:hypothetical protein
VLLLGGGHCARAAGVRGGTNDTGALPVVAIEVRPSPPAGAAALMICFKVTSSHLWIYPLEGIEIVAKNR